VILALTVGGNEQSRECRSKYSMSCGGAMPRCTSCSQKPSRGGARGHQASDLLENNFNLARSLATGPRTGGVRRDVLNRGLVQTKFSR
jgi:hypothetical protein